MKRENAVWLFVNYYVSKCSKCGYMEETDLAHYPETCNGCGADMREKKQKDETSQT